MYTKKAQISYIFPTFIPISNSHDPSIEDADAGAAPRFGAKRNRPGRKPHHRPDEPIGAELEQREPRQVHGPLRQQCHYDDPIRKGRSRGDQGPLPEILLQGWEAFSDTEL